MSTMKRCISFLLAMVMVAGLLPQSILTASAEQLLSEASNSETVEPMSSALSGSCGESLTWTLSDDGVLTISGTGSMTEYDDNLSYPWSPNSSSVTEVIIGDGVTTIGNNAFARYKSLTCVTIGNDVITIGESAFEYCWSLNSVTIPDGVTIISDYAFRYTDLISVTIPNSVTDIGRSAFAGCYSLSSVTIGNGVTTIGDYAFESCESLSSVTIPKSVNSIGYRTFYGCDSLTGFYVDDNNANYSSDIWGVLFDKDKVKLILAPGAISGFYEMPNSVTTIGESAFKGCTSLSSVTIPESVVSIGESAFEDCISLSSVTIPGSVTSVAGRAFFGCTSLSSVILPDSVTTISASTFYDCTSLTNVEIPDSVTTIGNSAFCGCENLRSVTIGDSVTTIGDSAFDSCEELTSVTIPDNVTSIGNSAFAYCTSLSSVTIGSGVKSIGKYAFAYCTSLISMEILYNVTSIGDRAFRSCSNLRVITFMRDAPYVGENTFSLVTATAYYPANNPTWGDDVLQNYGGTITWEASTALCVDHKYKVVVTKPTCTDQGYTTYTCSKCGDSYVVDETDALGHSFESVVNEYGELTYTCIICGDSYTEAALAGFQYTVYEDHIGITGYRGDAPILEIPAIIEGLPVTVIESYAFSDNTRLESVFIPDTVTVIGFGAFQGCWWMNSIIIPDSVTAIGNQAFMGCSGLYSITIPDGIIHIGERTFENCSSLRSVDIPDSVTSIGYRAFRWCTSLNSISIPNCVNEIDTQAFFNCNSLASITIPDSVRNIGSNAFGECTSLEEIYFDGQVPLIDDDTFYNVVATAYYDANLISWTQDVMQDYGGTITWVGLGDPYPTDLYYEIYEDHVEITGGWASLTEAIIPAEINRLPVTVISSSAFYDCANLISVTIPDSVTYIGAGAFEYCDNLTTINIPDSVTYIGEYAFMYCENLSSITIPDGINHIGDYAFYCCYKLTGSVTIPASLASVGIGIFAQCDSLTSVVFQDGVTSIVDQIFSSCNSMANITIPDTVTTIGEGAFENCRGLTYIMIPGSVTYIGDSAFYSCSGLKTIRFIGDAPEFGNNVFQYVNGSAYYPGGNPTWTTELMESCNDDSINWVAEGEVYGIEIVSTPEYGIVGLKPDLSELFVELIYDNDIQRPVTNSKLTISDIDTTTVGKKNVIVSYDDFSAEFTYGVHEATGVVLDPSLYPESSHDYGKNRNKTEILTWPGADCLELVFSEDSYLDWLDYLEIYDGKGNWISWRSGSGNGIAGATVMVPGDTVKIKFGSESGTGYGYSFDCITAKYAIHTGSVIIPAKEATCTEPGWTEGVICEICDQERYTVIPALGHAYGAVVTAPTCSELGYTTYACSNCGDTYVADEVAPTGHIEGEAVRENEVAATCISEGSYEAVVYCTACGIEISREVVTIHTIEHSYDAEITDPTCTEDGYTTYTCSVCGDSYVADEVDPVGHNFEDGVCTRCGEVEPTEPEEDPITIISQPADYVGLVGDTATFTVAAEGEGLKYQWYCSTDGGANWGTTGVTGDTQSVVFLAYRNHQLYRCVITDAEGNTVTTDAAELKAKEVSLEITGQPENYVGAVGDEATFTLVVSGNGLTYEWFVSSDGGATWAKSYMTGYMSDTQIAVLRPYRDGYKLYCKVSDVFGNTVNSDIVSMTVKSGAVKINSQPQSVENAAILQMYAFTVDAEGDNLTYLWEVSTNGGATWEQSWSDGYNTDTLNIRMYQYRDGYQYRCVVTSGLKTVVVTEAATLKLQAPSVAIETSPVSAYALLYEEVTMHAAATGMDLTYQWYYSTDDGATWVENWMTGYNTDMLTFVAIPTRAALYMCKVTDGSGTSVWTEPAQMKLLSAELKITSEPENFIGTVGDTASFTVAAEGEGVSYRWYLSSDGGATWSECWFDGYNTNRLSFYINASRAANQYRCVITDVAGNTITSSTVTVVAE